MSIKLIRKLQQEISDLTGGYIATWLPDFAPLIGDFGTLARGRLLTDGNLEDLGHIDIEHYIGVSEMESFKYTSDVTVSVDSGIDQIGAGFSIAFNREGSFLYHFQGARMHRIERKKTFFQELAYKIMTGEIEWDDAYVIVDEVVVAERSTILISKSSGGSVRIASGAQATPDLNFADPSLKLTFGMSKGTIFDYSGREDTRPLYHAVKPTIKPRGSVRGGPKPSKGGPSLSKLYDHAKALVGGRDIRPTEIEIEALEDQIVEASLTIDGATATFQIEFVDVLPDDVMADDLEPEDDIIKVEKFLVFEE